MKPAITCLTGLAAIALAASGGVAQAADASSLAVSHAAPAAATRPQNTSLLYNQDNHHSNDFVSQTHGVGNIYDTQGADDFTVPKGKTWTITQVDVPGVQKNGIPVSENVFFYKNTVNAKKQAVPGERVRKQTLKGKDSSGSLVITGITGVTLPAGHYWMSVQASLPSGEQWFWDTRSVQSGSSAVWRNPANGFGTGCTAWSNMKACGEAGGATPGPDFMFALYGTG